MRFMMMLIPKGYQSAAPDVVPTAESRTCYFHWSEKPTIREFIARSAFNGKNRTYLSTIGAARAISKLRRDTMPDPASIPPRVNGILETSLYVESAARSAEFYQRVFGFEPLEPGEPQKNATRCAQCVRVTAACYCCSRGWYGRHGCERRNPHRIRHSPFGIGRLGEMAH